MERRQNDDHQRYRSSCSSSSSTDSNANSYHRLNDSLSMVSPSYDCAMITTSSSFSTKDLSTDLRLGLSISSQDLSTSSPPRGQYSDWPPMKPLLRSTLAAGKSKCRRETLFVKVSMEGIPIGRKLDLLAHHGYHSLITTLVQMFRTTIISSDIICQDLADSCHILTYEDKEGDWMMVGDVPWEMFLNAVKRLKIVAFEKRQ